MIPSRPFWIAIVLLFLSACSSTRQAGQYYNTVNELGQTKTATVRLISGVEFEADLLRVMADSAYYIQPSTSLPAAVLTRDLVDITFKNRRKGAFKGLGNVLIGSAASIVGGFALARLGICNTSNDSQPYVPECAAYYMILLPIYVAPFTIPGGMAVGAIYGDRETYQVE